MAFMNNTVIKPALDNKESSREFSVALQRYFPSIVHSPIIGAVGKARKPEYHVYGDCTLIPIKKTKETFADIGSMPDLLLIREKDRDLYASVLSSGGYKEIYSDFSSGNNLYLFERRSEKVTQIETSVLSGPVLSSVDIDEKIAVSFLESSRIKSEYDL
jgi:hypothetical protein